MTSQSVTNPARALSSASHTRSLLRATFATEAQLSGLALRATLALVMFPHGAQKLLGWWGGYGLEGTHGFLTQAIGLPSLAAYGVILLEFLGPLALALGLATRWVALGFLGLMFGAIATVHAPHGFFMNWSGAQAGEGFEYHLLVIGLSLALVLQGGGRGALDRAVAARLGA
jgi:putative oxidoreductase